MVSNGEKIAKPDIQEDPCPPTSTNLFPDNQQSESKNTNPFLKFLTNRKFPKFGPSPSAKFLRFAQHRDDLSRSIRTEHPNPHSSSQNPNRTNPPSNHDSHRPHLKLLKNIDWPHVWTLTKQWFREPLNIALFVWILCVAISGAILFLVMTGMLNHAIRQKSQRNTWFEVNNQILNALFTLMCLYNHPKRIYHFILLLRWNPADILQLRKTYCKNATYKPHEWLHMMVVVALLNLNCFAQYALCGLNLGYPRSRRPALGVGITISVAIAAPAFAGLYNAISPLGKDYDLEVDEEAQKFEIVGTGTGNGLARLVSLERRYSFVQGDNRSLSETRPVWVGGLFDFWEDIWLAYLSIFCSCCVFGWNMQRLGFGNMYVHIVTFILFCSAPFFIFNLAAVNINDETLRESLVLTGVILCFLGLLYGGFWRIQMRKRYKLPGKEYFCFGPSFVDCFNWLCCCWCSLAQEVRTADYYEIGEETGSTGRTVLTGLTVFPLPREDGRTPLYSSGPSSPYLGRGSDGLKLESPVGNAMRAPVPSVIEKDGEVGL